MHRHVRTSLVTLAAVLVAMSGVACSGDDEDAAPATSAKSAPAETSPTAVSGTVDPDQPVRDASDFCTSLGSGGIQDLLGAAPAEVAATDTTCTWTREGSDGVHRVEVTMTSYTSDTEAQDAVSGDETPAPGMDSFSASALSFGDDEGTVQVASGPAVVQVVASGPGLTAERLTAAVTAMLQG